MSRDGLVRVGDLLLTAMGRLAEEAKKHPARIGVRPFIRANLDLINQLHHHTGSWSAVADLLSQRGLRWRNGRPLTASQLRSLLSVLGARGQPATPIRAGPLEKPD